MFTLSAYLRALNKGIKEIDQRAKGIKEEKESLVQELRVDFGTIKKLHDLVQIRELPLVEHARTSIIGLITQEQRVNVLFQSNGLPTDQIDALYQLLSELKKPVQFLRKTLKREIRALAMTNIKSFSRIRDEEELPAYERIDRILNSALKEPVLIPVIPEYTRVVCSGPSTLRKIAAVILVLFSIMPAAFAGLFRYQVKQGDSLLKICKSYEGRTVSYENIVAINRQLNPKFDPNRLSIGQTIVIPLREQTPTAGSSEQSYTIKEGDIISDIALQFNVNTDILIKENKLDPRRIMPGTRIRIPKDKLPIIRISLLSDTEMNNPKTMSRDDIQKFLESYNSRLAKEYDKQMPADVILYWAHQERINPIIILTKLEAEHNLVTTPDPKQDYLDWAGGVGVPDKKAKVKKWKGLYKQIEGIATRLKEYQDNAGTLKHFIDTESAVALASNRATYALIVYTPHTKPNQRFAGVYARFKAYIEQREFEVPKGTRMHFVQPGENLSKIATGIKKNLGLKCSIHIVLDLIQRINHLSSDHIRTNQKLLVPSEEYKILMGTIMNETAPLSTQPDYKPKNLTGMILKKGSRVQLISRTPKKEDIQGSSDYWYKINIEGKEFWVFGGYLSIWISGNEAGTKQYTHLQAG